MLATKNMYIDIRDFSEGLTFICAVPRLVGTGTCTGADTLSLPHWGSVYIGAN